MNGRQSGLTPSDILSRVRKGLSLADIAREFNVTRQYVSHLAKQLGESHLTPRQVVLKHFPWETPAKFNSASPNRLVRDHLEFMATGGDRLSPKRLERLLAFYRKLRKENVVVEFDPDIPPSDGISAGGFSYRPREPMDGDLIIRVNGYTEITPEGRELLKLPPTLPTVRKGTTECN